MGELNNKRNCNWINMKGVKMKDNIKALSQGLIDIGGSLSEITKAASEASEGLAGTLR